MRRVVLVVLVVIAVGTTVLAGNDQSGRVRRVHPQPQSNPGSSEPATAQADPASGDANSASSAPSKEPEKIAVNVKCNASYDGGSLNLARNQKLTLTVKDDILALNTKSSSFEIPTSQITELSYSQNSRNRTAEGIGVGAVNRTAGVLLGNTRTTSHYLQILWAGSPAGGVSLRVDKDDIRGVLAALEAATGIKSRSEGGRWQ